MLDLHHILLRDTVSDNNSKIQFSFDRLEDGILGESRRYVDNSGISTGFLFGIGTILEHWEAKVGAASFLRGDTSNHLSAVFESLLGLEGTLRGRQVSRMIKGIK